MPSGCAGLGWELFEWGGRRVIGHDGGTIGQIAFLRAVPDAGVAIALLTNGGDVMGLFRDVFEPLLAETAGVYEREGASIRSSSAAAASSRSRRRPGWARR